MDINCHNTFMTTWEDENLAEWDIKIEYRLSDYKPQIDDPDHPLFGPEEETEVEVSAIYRHEPYAINGVETGMHWVEWIDESDDDLENWCVEILQASKEGE